MAREKPYYRETVADIIERTGKMVLGVNDVKNYLHIGYNRAAEYLGDEKNITVYQLAQKLI